MNILKTAYKHIPLKAEIFTALKGLWVPPKQIYQHLHFHGVFPVSYKEIRLKLLSTGCFIENEIFWEGLESCWEKVSMSIWFQLARSGGVVFDVGANTGIYALVAAAANSKNDVYAFEPQTKSFEILETNKRLNNFRNLNCEKLALSDFNGNAKFYYRSEINEYAPSLSPDAETVRRASSSETVSTVRAESFLEMRQIERIDLMKIDVERHEPEVLRGLGGALQKFKPTILIEVLNKDVADQISNIVETCNYEFYNLDEKGSVRKSDRIEKSDYYNYLLIQPERRKEIFPSSKLY